MDLSDVAKRRMHRIACHIGAVQCGPSNTSARTSLATLVCSSGSGILSGIRKDNRLLYSRQGSHTQAFYMQQSTGSQVMFSNEEECTDPQQVIDKTSGSEVKPFFPRQDWQLREPLFSKPASDSKGIKEYGGLSSVEGVPLFARRADGGDGKMSTTELVQNKRRQLRNENIGLEWFPRMDIVESASTYVVTVELPGVDAESIRVEVNSNSLTISGTRSTGWWLNLSRGAIYHRRELLQGPYRVIWHIPQDANVDSITAEFIDGFLRILAPKLLA